MEGTPVRQLGPRRRTHCGEDFPTGRAIHGGQRGKEEGRFATWHFGRLGEQDHLFVLHYCFSFVPNACGKSYQHKIAIIHSHEYMWYMQLIIPTKDPRLLLGGLRVANHPPSNPFCPIPT